MRSDEMLWVRESYVLLIEIDAISYTLARLRSQLSRNAEMHDNPDDL